MRYFYRFLLSFLFFTDKIKDMDGFFERLLGKLEEKNLIRADLCRALGISEGTVRNWKKGVMPAADTALKIAQYLDVSLEYLITGKEKGTEKKIKKSDSDFLESFKKLPEPDREEIKAILKMKLQRYEREEKKEGLFCNV